MPWFKVTRKRVVEQEVFVKAPTRAHASHRVSQMDWEGETGDELVRAFKDSKPVQIKGIPRWLWEELGCPDDERIGE